MKEVEIYVHVASNLTNLTEFFYFYIALNLNCSGFLAVIQFMNKLLWNLLFCVLSCDQMSLCAYLSP